MTTTPKPPPAPHPLDALRAYADEVSTDEKVYHWAAISPVRHAVALAETALAAVERERDEALAHARDAGRRLSEELTNQANVLGAGLVANKRAADTMAQAEADRAMLVHIADATGALTKRLCRPEAAHIVELLRAAEARLTGAPPPVDLPGKCAGCDGFHVTHEDTRNCVTEYTAYARGLKDGTPAAAEVEGASAPPPVAPARPQVNGQAQCPNCSRWYTIDDGPHVCDFGDGAAPPSERPSEWRPSPHVTPKQRERIGEMAQNFGDSDDTGDNETAEVLHLVLDILDHRDELLTGAAADLESLRADRALLCELGRAEIKSDTDSGAVGWVEEVHERIVARGLELALAKVGK